LNSIAKIFRDAFYIAIFFSGIAIIMMQFPNFILKLFKVKDELIFPTTQYLRALSIGVPAIFLFFTLRYIAEGSRRPIPVLIVSILGFIVNAVLNYSFTNGISKFGIPEMGVWGSGLGTGITFWIMLIAMFCLVNADNRLRTLKIYREFGLPNLKHLWSILKLGLPNGASIFAEITIFSVALLMLSRFSDAVIGSHQVALNISGMAFMIPLSLSFALTSVVGHTMGRGDKVAAIRIGYMGIFTCLFMMFITASILYFARFILPTIFSDNADILSLTANLLIFAAIFQISDGLQVSANGALRGLKDTKVPMFICIAAYWFIGIPLGYVLGVLCEWKAQGVWIGLIVGLSSAAIMLNIRFRRISQRLLKHLS
jgi:MATE family multidrug resistance protein